MADINENQTPTEFPATVREVETTDPVLGGPTGPVNLSLKILANRTRWLKNALAMASAFIDTHSGNKSNPHEVTKTQVGLSNLPNAVSDSTSLDSSASLGTSKAIKLCYDKAVEALTKATNALTIANTALTQLLADARYVLKSQISGSITSISVTNVASSLAIKTVNDRITQVLEQGFDVEAGDARYVRKTQVANTTSSTSEITVGSSLAVKTAYDRGTEAINVANTKLNLTQGDARYLQITLRSDSVVSTSSENLATSAAVKLAYDRATDAKFPTGTRMLFVQTAAPVGWSKVTTHNNKALRIVSGNGGGSGGNQTFTGAFKNQAVSGNTNSKSTGGSVTVNNHTLSEAQMPHHWHDYGSASVTAQFVPGSVQSAGHSTHFRTSGKGGTTGHAHTASFSGSSHNHSFSGSVNMAVQYVDAIICQKN
jgi:hypothetical protein